VWVGGAQPGNAGVLGFGDVLTGDRDVFERDLKTNYIGALRVARAFLPALRTAASGGGAAIVNVVSLLALAPVGMVAGYCASKAAAHSMTQALRAAVRGDGIEVVGAYPGQIDTGMLAGAEAADKADPAVVAARILTAVEAEAAPTRFFPARGAGSRGAACDLLIPMLDLMNAADPIEDHFAALRLLEVGP
jgi:NAD(P)-dependent dehydrogenase (short-subunit alcohol dehydrogenase family)